MKKITWAILIAVAITGQAGAQATLREKQFNIDKGVAIQGYDPVAYFTQNKPVKGTKEFTVYVEGITYYFSSAVNKDLFIKDYKKYEPQYGGWCAYAMGATNEKVEIDPGTFKITGGKLYLFYHSWINNTLTKWNKNEAGLKPQADKNWLAVYH
ncbi:MAG: YHS domain-containing (seleno)protein [Ferruginibacter sp.]